MQSNIVILFATFFCIQARGQPEIQPWERAQVTVSPPTCSLYCLGTIVPQYCDSLTNITCICTNTPLTAALKPCTLAACNITEALQLQRYSAESCGVLNDKSRQNEQLRVECVLLALATIFVIARLYVRTKLDIGLGADDWVMLAALCAYFTCDGIGLGMALQGFGQHTFWLSTHEVSKALMLFFIGEFFYFPAITLTKLSLLLFFRRIFPHTRLRIGIWIMFGFITLCNLSLTIVTCFQCVPFHANWTNWMYKVPPIKCFDRFAVAYVAAGMSILHDIIILVMPIPILLSLNLTWQKKINVLAMFSVGSLVIICSVLRLSSLRKLKSSTDPSYDQAPIAVWTSLEVGVGLICGCLPASRSLIGHIFPSLKMILLPSNRGNTPVHGNQSRSKNKQDRRGPDPSTIGLIELDYQQGYQDGASQTMNAGASVKIHGSEIPIIEKLVPVARREYGNRVSVTAEDVEGQRNESGNPGI